MRVRVDVWEEGIRGYEGCQYEVCWSLGRSTHNQS